MDDKGGETEERMRRLEIEEDKRRRERRKRNIVIRGVRAKEEGLEGLKKEVEEVMRTTAPDAKVVEFRRIAAGTREGGEMVWVSLESVEDKIRVMKGKGRLRDRKEWISDDLTERERRTEWLLRRAADRRRREGKSVRMGYMKLWEEGELWIWDEVKEKLRTAKGGEMKKGEEGEDRERGTRSKDQVF